MNKHQKNSAAMSRAAIPPTYQRDDLKAYCHSCPAPEEVTAFLNHLGCCLDFQMEACIPPTCLHLAVLPAQFHYMGPAGMRVIYLSGRDPNAEDVRHPRHASRFWASCGADAGAFHQLAHAMARRWSLTWQPSQALPTEKEVA